jgi:ParB/RepB/Spo0J family partition protein
MSLAACSERLAAPTELGDRMSALRLGPKAAHAEMRASMSRHGQLTPVAVYETNGALEVIDGFKRLHVARELDLDALRVITLELNPAQAKAAMLTLNASCRLSEIEEAWLVRALYREDRLSQPEIGHVLGRHKSWVHRRLALVESLDECLQADLRLGLISASAARELARLPRGNQKSAADIVLKWGLTAHQTARLVQKLLACADADGREKTLYEADSSPPGHVDRPKRARTPAEQILVDAGLIARTAGRLQARLLEAPLEALGEAAADLVQSALGELHPVLSALRGTIERTTKGTSCNVGRAVKS